MKRLLTSCFGLGWLPVAPGTWGSLPPTFIFGLMYQFQLSGILILIAMAAFILAGSVVCVSLASYVVALTGKTDPREVVVDEVAGQAVTFLIITMLLPRSSSTWQVWVIAVGGFLLFRLFDIAKPWPIRKLEKLPEGWGILADDILAGVYAGIVLLIIIFLWIGS